MVREFRLRRYYIRMDNVFSKRLRIYDGRNGRPWGKKLREGLGRLQWVLRPEMKRW